MSGAVARICTAFSVSALALLTACGAPAEPRGTITERYTKQHCVRQFSGSQSCRTAYRITVRPLVGRSTVVRLTRSEWDRCRRWSQYPACLAGGSR